MVENSDENKTIFNWYIFYRLLSKTQTHTRTYLVRKQEQHRQRHTQTHTYCQTATRRGKQIHTNKQKIKM